MFDQADGRADDLVNAVFMVGYTGSSDRGHLPQVMIIDLGNRKIELLLQAH